MSPELRIHHDPEVPPEEWNLPAEAIDELRRAASSNAAISLATENVGFTGFGTAPRERLITRMAGVLTEVEPGKVVIDVSSGLVSSQVEGEPGVKVSQLSGTEIGNKEIPVYREIHVWGIDEETLRESPGGDDPDDYSPVTGTEYIAFIGIEGGREFHFDAPPPHFRF